MSMQQVLYFLLIYVLVAPFALFSSIVFVADTSEVLESATLLFPKDTICATLTSMESADGICKALDSIHPSAVIISCQLSPKYNQATISAKETEIICSTAQIIHKAKERKIPRLIFCVSHEIYPQTLSILKKESELFLKRKDQPHPLIQSLNTLVEQVHDMHKKGYTWTICPTCELYGPKMELSKETENIIGTLLFRFLDAKQKERQFLVIPFQGSEKKELLYSDDFIHALLYIMKQTTCPPVLNIGFGSDQPLSTLLTAIQGNYRSEKELIFDPTDNRYETRSLLDTTQINQLGWSPIISFSTGIHQTIRSYTD